MNTVHGSWQRSMRTTIAFMRKRHRYLHAKGNLIGTQMATLPNHCIEVVKIDLSIVPNRLADIEESTCRSAQIEKSFSSTQR